MCAFCHMHVENLFKGLALTSDKQMLSVWFFLKQVLCWEYYSKPKNLVVIWFIKYPNFEFIDWKKERKISESEGFLTHDNYEQKIVSNYNFFRQVLSWEYYSKLSVLHFKDLNFEFKSWKNKIKCWKISSFFKF